MRRSLIAIVVANTLAVGAQPAKKGYLLGDAATVRFVLVEGI